MLGHDMAKDRFAALARMNFSSPYVALPQKLSVEENLRVYAHFYNVPNVTRRIGELCDELDLHGFLSRPAPMHRPCATRLVLLVGAEVQTSIGRKDEPQRTHIPDRPLAVWSFRRPNRQ